MADLVNIKDFGGTSVPIMTDEVTDGTLGTAQVQYIKIMDGSLNGTNKLVINSSGQATVAVAAALPAGTNNIGDVDIVSMPAVTNGGTFVVQENGAALTALQLLDDTVVTLGTDTYTEATSKGLVIGAVRRDADTTLVNTTNEFGPLQMDANGRLKVEVFSGETLPVSGTVAATQSGTWTLAANQSVNVAQMNGVTVTTGNGASGTGVQRVTIASDSTGQIIALGNVASDAVDSGNPVKIGGQARTTNPVAVANADRVNAVFDKVGRQVVVNGHVRELVNVQTTTITASTAETTIVTAAASTFHDITHLTITNSSATATTVTIKDSTGGTTRAIYSIAAGGGVTIPFNPPMPQATVNNNWTATCGSSVSSIYINVVYVKNI